MLTTKSAGHTSELARLAHNHAVFQAAMDGQLVVAPVGLRDGPKRILDSATADGTWLRSVRDTVADTGVEHEYWGVDIEPELFPLGEDAKQGMNFLKQSFLDSWPVEMQGNFDLVHQRLGLAGSSPKKPVDVIRGLAGLLKRGGWLQLGEIGCSTCRRRLGRC